MKTLLTPPLRLPLLLLAPFLVTSFSASPLGGGSGGSGSGIGLDRFRATCPADPSCIRQFDAKLVEETENEKDSSSSTSASSSIWVAVYRSNNNQPSVFVRDEFLYAMKTATGTDATDASAVNASNSAPINDKLQTPMSLETPVAVAQLRPSSDFDDQPHIVVLDAMRCGLRKEEMNEACDGGSEFIEALSVGVDSLLLYHLQQQRQQQQKQDSDDDKTILFEGAIRTKATLFNHQLLEDRGFAPVEALSKDMATHVSAYDACLQQYATRSVETSLPAGARDRALQIVSLLGQLDRNQQQQQGAALNDEDEDDYDPWANIKMQL
jgi:hypothetical protein